TGCKDGDSPSSSQKSLDNFAGESFTWNDCQRPLRASDKAYADKISAGAFATDVMQTLAAVPEGLRDAFFAAPLNGRILVTNDIVKACPAAAKHAGSQASDVTLSCLRSKGAKGPLVIVIKADADD